MSTELKSVPTPKAEPVKKSSFTKIALGTVVIGALAVGGGFLGYDNYMYITTDNANVQASTTLISSKISGVIEKAVVQENQKVKAGDVLLEIKSDDFQAVNSQLQAEVDSLSEELKGAETNYKRAKELFADGASTKERVDSASTQYLSLQSKLKGAQAQVSASKLNLGYTKILAPADGKVGRKSFEVGMLAAPGQPLFGFVAGQDRWIVANLKETDMDFVQPGKKVEVTVDAISDRRFEGEVESISPTTGATFSLLPPDNATGNFTKVVQRVPVRIKLNNISEKDADRLQAGLSAEVRIRIR